MLAGTHICTHKLKVIYVRIKLCMYRNLRTTGMLKLLLTCHVSSKPSITGMCTSAKMTSYGFSSSGLSPRRVNASKA